jgi:hypothetical protein
LKIARGRLRVRRQLNPLWKDDYGRAVDHGSEPFKCCTVPFLAANTSSAKSLHALYSCEDQNVLSVKMREMRKILI